MLQTNGADVHKIVNKGNKVNTTEEESEMNKDAANVKVEGSDLNKEKDIVMNRISKNKVKMMER